MEKDELLKKAQLEDLERFEKLINNNTESDEPAIDIAFVLLKLQIRKILNKLQPLEQDILCMRFGLIDGYSYTIPEVTEKYNISKDELGEIERKALNLIKELKI